ncbi:MAG: putative transposase [Bacteriovoracaceae bacterium]|jgi:putative transposase
MNRYIFEDIKQYRVIKKLPNFIEEVYNAKRLYSSLGYKIPLAYEKELTYRAS